VAISRTEKTSIVQQLRGLNGKEGRKEGKEENEREKRIGRKVRNRKKEIADAVPYLLLEIDA
jgi:hypothetical protein